MKHWIRARGIVGLALLVPRAQAQSDAALTLLRPVSSTGSEP